MSNNDKNDILNQNFYGQQFRIGYQIVSIDTLNGPLKQSKSLLKWYLDDKSLTLWLNHQPLQNLLNLKIYKN